MDGRGETAGGRVATSVAAGVGAGAIENESAPADRSGQVTARTNRIGSLPEADVRGSSVRFDAATEETVNKMTIADAKKFYADNYGAARAHLYVAGKFDVATVKKAIEAGFSGWAKGPAAVENVPKPKAQRLLDVTDRPGAPQATVYVGLPVPNATSPDNIPLGVTNALLEARLARGLPAIFGRS